METLNCIIIEDQLPAQRILADYIDKVPNLKLVDTFIDPLESIGTLEREKIDILFLDVHLPNISGIDFLRTLYQPPSIILTTAFTEYALEGFELDVVDYLLKPFSFERFLRAISKIKRFIQNDAPIFHQRYLFVRTQGIIQKIKIENIRFVEAKGGFVLIHTTQNRYTANASLQDILMRLDHQFVRCHKSYVVNIIAIDKIVGNRIKIENHSIAIGRTYREQLIEQLQMI